ncbi:hypothetical protein [Vulcanisaeta distributa]|uniref:hypothetical protein n=1 Tax=Vulcanisaeta distributa TaxID=164451 RepID=UPI0006D05073|nr:hypothetical protein [Vulcanisaeta distributa]
MAIIRAVDAPLFASIMMAIIISVIVHTPVLVLVTAQALLLGLMGAVDGYSGSRHRGQEEGIGKRILD